MATPKRRTVLFLLNSEHGQANVVLGTIYELLQQTAVAVDLHIASFAPLKARCDALVEWQKSRSATSSSSSTLKFHTISGLAMVEAIVRNHSFQFMEHEPNFSGALKAMKLVPDWLSAWDPPEYIKAFEECMKIIGDVQPDVIVLDFLFSQGIDACKALGRRWVVLTPNTLRELVVQLQPVSHMFFKYPAMGTNYPYPLPWSKVLPNLYLQFSLILNMVTNPRLKAIGKYRNEHGAPGILPAYEPYNEKNYYLTSTLPSIDYPYVNIPSNLTFCGPIVTAGPPVSECDPELAQWLKRAPTVLVNLGTISTYSSESAQRFALALKTFLSRNSKVQILWKIKFDGEPRAILNDTLGKELDSGRIKVVNWLVPEISVILETGDVVCSIHHGGANSFFEAVRGGIPTIILPAWLDCYAFATLAEHYGCGIFGNKDSAPKINSDDLVNALLRILGDDETPGDASFAKAAKTLAKEAEQAGGRVTACQKILEFAESGEW